jgi:hypothetical protein
LFNLNPKFSNLSEFLQEFLLDIVLDVWSLEVRIWIVVFAVDASALGVANLTTLETVAIFFKAF